MGSRDNLLNGDLCISSPQITLLINGAPTTSFIPSRGLHQDCPLSPYLFILSFQVLSSFLNSAIHAGLLRVYRQSDGLYFSHLFYADDCILLAHATLRDVVCLEAIVDVYCNHLGQ